MLRGNIAPGTRLGPYEVLAPIGAGGMGEVYRARDTRLDRSVAIKVLPERLSSNATLRERFAREAKTISNITHPHICALYDVGQSDGTDYLVMEYLEGETLADRLSRGALPPEQVIRYGVQIAEALHAAHKQGVVHRDLKPANIMLTKSGAKLLDFGLAKMVEAAVLPDDTIAQATERGPLTEEGIVLGTFQYMAPEQVEGRAADPRSDIFALGAVLYEMATGRRAFDGTSRASLIASILDRDPPPVSSVAPASPPALDRVIRTCLAKDPDERWQNAHDIATELRWIADTSSDMLAERGRRGVRQRALWAIAGAVAGAAAGALATWLALRTPHAAASVARFTIPLPPNAPLSYGRLSAVAISPDGTRIVYCAKDGEETHLYIRGIGQLAPAVIPGTDGGSEPSFSPDSRALAFVAHERLKTIRFDGGAPTTLADAAGGGSGICWYGDTIYFVREFGEGIWSIPEHGGTLRRVIKSDPAKGARAVVWPEVLPGGDVIVATVWNNGTWDEAKIVAYPLRAGEPKVLVDGGSFGRYAASGHLLYMRSGSLFAVAFDSKSLRAGGNAVPLVNGVASGAINGEAHFAVSRNGTLLYVPGGALEDRRTLLWVDRRGNEERAVPTQRPYADPALSPDGRTVAVTLQTATFDIWQLDLERDSLTRVSFGGDDSRPHWTPDGNRIIWNSSRSGHENVYWAAADNGSGEQRLTTSSYGQLPTDVSPDGRLLAFTEKHPQSGDDIMLVPLQGGAQARPFIVTRFNETGLAFSPDGKWCVYASNETGSSEIYLRPFPGPGGRWQVSIGGGSEAEWTRDGREIVYHQRTRMYAVPVATTPRVSVGKPQLLFEKPWMPGWWSLSRDGQRVLTVRPEAPPTTSQMQIVMNWFEDLKNRVPQP